jgi:trehalose-6-phosphate synthase
MPREEIKARMQRLRAHVNEHNVYRWAGSLIGELAAIRLEITETGPTNGWHIRPANLETAEMRVVAG